ncbi:MAG: N-methyl-L-tryptophan oxidase [Phycisphaeraceae bacterium]|nr:N-methyl-L-tryptophan oxidase [Phycisphaeraceae bacterium]
MAGSWRCAVTPEYHTIIIGLGAMGSSAALHLARRGVRVLGLEQFDIPHGNGSSHGYSRMIRMAYFEHPDYVPLLRRAYELWRDLEVQAGSTLLHVTGGVYIGPGSGSLVPGSLRSAQNHGLAHEVLSRRQLAQRYPQFEVPSSYEAVYEEAAGLLVPEAVVAAQAGLALQYGAELKAHEPVMGWEADSTGVCVRTHGGMYRAEKLIIAGGAWASRCVDWLPIRVHRQVLAWVWPADSDRFRHPQMPVWAIEPEAAVASGEYYGFPIRPEAPGFKVALHRPGRPIDPDRLHAAANRPDKEDEAEIRECLARYIPDANGNLLGLRTCMYSMSPDSHFIIDRLSEHPNVSVACGFSGHGFKFASVVGEILADMAQSGATRHPIGFLSLARLSQPKP